MKKEVGDATYVTLSPPAGALSNGDLVCWNPAHVHMKLPKLDVSFHIHSFLPPTPPFPLLE